MGKIKLPEDVRKFFQKAGRKGGKARAKKLTAEQLSEIGKQGALAAKKMGKQGGRPKKKRVDKP